MEESVSRATEALRGRLDGREPEILLTLGSGLSTVADGLEDAVDIPTAEVPGMAASRVPGHQARLRCGRLSGRTVLAQLGRVHLYEGHDAGAVTRPVDVAAALGATTYLVTNAAGGLDPSLTPGDLLVLDDHLNLTGTSPLIGRMGEHGPQFVDMADAYDASLRQLAHRLAAELGFTLRSGVYAGLVGPAYETPAEVAMLRGLGAHAVGMSTVNEVIAARAQGLRVLGVSSITNVHGEGVATSHEEVLEVGRQASTRLARLLVELLEAM